MMPSIVIVGAGPSGIGMGILLKKLGVEDFVILEKGEVGNSFLNWPAEMRMITPSFTGQGFGALDLNSIYPATSPAYTLKKERLSGKDYALYLDLLVDHLDLPIEENIEVTSVKKENNQFRLMTDEGYYDADIVIWATGEYQFPNLDVFTGIEHCLHNSRVGTWNNIKGKEIVVIGGQESGIDAAVNLINLGKNVTVISKKEMNQKKIADPSLTLSPFTWERLNNSLETDRLQFKEKVEVIEVLKDGETFKILLSDGSLIESSEQPILATGFKSGALQVQEMFEWMDNGKPKLTDYDESTITKNLFLIGPSVQHKKVIFCFIYKFRQRFAIVAKEIVERFNLDHNSRIFNYYKQHQMLLDDLTCCEVECEC